MVFRIWGSAERYGGDAMQICASLWANQQRTGLPRLVQPAQWLKQTFVHASRTFYESAVGLKRMEVDRRIKCRFTSGIISLFRKEDGNIHPFLFPDSRFSVISKERTFFRRFTHFLLAFLLSFQCSRDKRKTLRNE